MAWSFGDNLRLRATEESQTGEGVPQIMKSDPSQSCLPDDPGEIVGQHARVNRLPIVIGEYRVVESGRNP